MSAWRRERAAQRRITSPRHPCVGHRFRYANSLWLHT
eukprot:gene11222-biopygen8405